MSFFVYILASRRNGTLYIGMTDNLVRRLWEHRNGLITGLHQKVWRQNARVVQSHHTKRGKAHSNGNANSKNGIGPGSSA